MKPNRVAYLESMAEELHSQSSRVRDLIGDAHWLSDGHHKEQLLRSFIARHLPAGIIAARGFVISTVDDLCSKEQDVLLVDTLKEPPVFNQGDLVIAFPRTVVAAISVKTELGKEEIADSVAGLNTVREVAMKSGHNGSIWCGSYHFENSATVTNNVENAYRYIVDHVVDSPPIGPLFQTTSAVALGPDMICSAKNLAFKITYSREASLPATCRVRGFDCGRLATSVFMAELLDHLAIHRDLVDADFARFAEHGVIKPLSPSEKSGVLV